MDPSPWSWNPAWDEVAVVAAMSLAYAAAVRRYGASRARVGAFAGAQLLVLAVSVTPLGTLALNYLLSAHLLQNVVLAEWAPSLAVLGLSAPMAATVARIGVVRALTRPVVALPLWVLSYALWHVPVVYDAALRHHFLLHLEHATYFGAGLLLWWPLVHARPWRLSSAAKATYAFCAFLLASPLGLLLTFLPEPVYEFYENAPRIWGLTALADQQIAGLVMSASEAVVFFAVFTFFFLRFLAEEAEPAAEVGGDT
ncbi:MAG: cytochrome c oxidase assembly protein [Actinobacteria bacterium]|nr:cytochrome c oxidase assembly protein [Actinomycetota bacterium]